MNQKVGATDRAESRTLNEAWPEDGLESVERCPVCDHASRDLLHENLRDALFFCAPGTWNLYRCRSCGSGYLDPRPTSETIGLAYSSYFTHDSKREQGSEKLSVARRLLRGFANGYYNNRFGTNRKPSIAFGSFLAKWLPRQRAMLDADVRHLQRAPLGATLLDVGCGNGDFLEFAIALGWKAEGLDFDPQAVEIARRRGFLVHQGEIETLPDRAEHYDTITLGHTIEHVHDPLALLSACFRLLKPGGVLWLETPNLNSPGHAYYGRHWRGLEPPRHLVLFTWQSLNSTVTRLGFNDVKLLSPRFAARFTFPASEAIRLGKDPIQEANHSLFVHWRAWLADRKAPNSITQREFIILMARKPEK